MSVRRASAPFDPALLTRIADRDRWCLFLDVDGTLLDIAPTPDGVFVDPSLRDLLFRLREAFGGAVALVSGRPLANLDELFRLGPWPAAGLHGSERRDAAGRTHVSVPDCDRLALVRAAMRRFVAEMPGVLLEDKGCALALHYRAAPEAEWTLRRAMEDWVARLAPDFHFIDGKRVFEIKPVAANKGAAIRAFLREPPFAGRTPMFLGDDFTDLDGFMCVELAGGLSIAVGDPMTARLHLASPREVRAFLSHFIDRPDTP